jgi:hypothetical protein
LKKLIKINKSIFNLKKMIFICLNIYIKMIKAKFIDFQNIRLERQKYNNNLIYKLIKENNIEELIKLCNKMN